jgi:hypothetical protein
MSMRLTGVFNISALPEGTNAIIMASYTPCRGGTIPAEDMAKSVDELLSRFGRNLNRKKCA